MEKRGSRLTVAVALFLAISVVQSITPIVAAGAVVQTVDVPAISFGDLSQDAGSVRLVGNLTTSSAKPGETTPASFNGKLIMPNGQKYELALKGRLEIGSVDKNPILYGPLLGFVDQGLGVARVALGVHALPRAKKGLYTLTIGTMADGTTDGIFGEFLPEISSYLRGRQSLRSSGKSLVGGAEISSADFDTATPQSLTRYYTRWVSSGVIQRGFSIFVNNANGTLTIPTGYNDSPSGRSYLNLDGYSDFYGLGGYRSGRLAVYTNKNVRNSKTQNLDGTVRVWSDTPSVEAWFDANYPPAAGHTITSTTAAVETARFEVDYPAYFSWINNVPQNGSTSSSLSIFYWVPGTSIFGQFSFSWVTSSTTVSLSTTKGSPSYNRVAWELWKSSRFDPTKTDAPAWPPNSPSESGSTLGFSGTAKFDFGGPSSFEGTILSDGQMRAELIYAIDRVEDPITPPQ